MGLRGVYGVREVAPAFEDLAVSRLAPMGFGLCGLNRKAAAARLTPKITETLERFLVPDH